MLFTLYPNLYSSLVFKYRKYFYINKNKNMTCKFNVVFLYVIVLPCKSNIFVVIILFHRTQTILVISLSSVRYITTCYLSDVSLATFVKFECFQWT